VLSMSNRRIIWLTLLLILCVAGGGLYYALFSARPPFNISCRLAEDKVTQLRFLVCRGLIASRLAQFAEQKGKDVAKWNRVEVYYSSGSWRCYVYEEEDKDLPEWCVEIADNGKTQEDTLFNQIVKNRRDVKRKVELQEKEWRELEAARNFLERLAQLRKEQEEVDFLIQPLIW